MGIRTYFVSKMLESWEKSDEVRLSNKQISAGVTLWPQLAKPPKEKSRLPAKALSVAAFNSLLKPTRQL